jgi:homoserine kinase
VRFAARVPATSANLGPGFDCLGLALSLHNEVILDLDAPPSVSWEGEGAAELPTDGSDMVSRAIARAATALGASLPEFALHGVNAIPLARGLGSSSAATVAGIALAGAVAEATGGSALGDDQVFALAAEFEGHPDNAAPAVYGGFTIADGGGRPVRLDPHVSLRPVALVPTEVRLSTEAARQALPAEVSMADAVFNLRKTAEAVVAFTMDPARLAGALQDRLHQDVRLALVPTVRVVFERLVAVGVPVCVSGAGPTLMAFEADEAPVPDLGEGWEVLRLDIDTHGAVVEHAR